MRNNGAMTQQITLHSSEARSQTKVRAGYSVKDTRGTAPLYWSRKTAPRLWLSQLSNDAPFVAFVASVVDRTPHYTR